MARCCLNPINWLDITAVNTEQIQFAQCIRSWGGDECVIALMQLDEATSVKAEQLWNDPKARFARAEVCRDGLAAWCRGCPRLAGGLEPTVATVDWNEVSDHWTRINLAYDKSCNLCCLSCRADAVCHQAGSEHYQKLMQLETNIVRPVLRKAEWAYLSGLGDPFGSPAYWHLLSTLRPDEAPNLRWHIQTNGLGFGEVAYAVIPTRGQIASVQFSIDAAQRETYKRIRGGDWGRLQRNLKFVSRLRSKGEVQQFAISMVVQSENWGQMADFVQMGRNCGVDIVQFNCLLNQGTYDERDYADRAVHLPTHPRFREFAEACERVSREVKPKVMIEIPRVQPTGG